MTTYGTFEIDSVPAPSDFELEAADIARHTIATRREPPTLSHAQLKIVEADTFNEFVKANGILADRKLFHEFTGWMRVLRLDDGLEYSDLWSEFNEWGRAATIAAQDACDLRETQQDALI